MRRLLAAGLFLVGSICAALAQQPNTSNLVSGTNSATGTAATTIIAAPTTTRRIFVTAVQCARTDAGTSAIRVTFNDDATSVLVLPNNGGGGGNNAVFASPLTVASATAFTFTASAGTSTVYCNAQGFTGN